VYGERLPVTDAARALVRSPDGHVRWGIVGCGDVTEKKSGPAFQKAEGSSLVAVMRRDAQKAEDYARRHGVPRFYTNVDALLADPEVDAVYVATPPSSHAELALRVARAGKPCYVEKPMAVSVAECDAMLAAFREAGLPLFVAYYRRMLPRFRKIRALVADGAIGAPRLVQSSLWKPTWPPEHDPATLPWRVVPEISGGGHFVDLASHLLDFLDHLLGPVVEAKGLASHQAGLYRAEDTVGAALRFGSGVVGTLSFCFAGPGRHDMNVLIGDRGTLRFSTFGQEPVILERDGGQESFDLKHPEHFQQPLIQTVVDELRGLGTCPSTGESAARTTRVMSAILADYYARSLLTAG
jgi:1,5-anhydro-D-fructose reductase (1,5-anhydro-D-mannitol-forming)